MRRDTYHDYITGMQMAERPLSRDVILDAMWRRSGLVNIINRAWRIDQRFDIDAIQVTVFADSKGWTG